MKAIVLGVSAAALLTASGGAMTTATGFAYGVAAGEITEARALVWTRAPRAGALTLELTGPGSAVSTKSGRASSASDLTVRIQLDGLRPGTLYSYRFRQGGALSPIGRFRTAPLATRSAPVRFAISGDADATPGSNGQPTFNRFQVYARMAAERNDFNINLGDTIYSDSSVGGAKAAMTVKDKWAKYRQNLSLAPLRAMRAAAGSYSHWDDHEFINDFSKAEHGDDIYENGAKAFTDYAPVKSGALGLYRRFRWGKHLELFFLDERSFRSAKASAGGTCNVLGSPDLAPTVPPAVRQAFTLLAPPLAQPVPQACNDRINDPSRTLLGARQLKRFLSDVKRSSATFKVIVNETPMMQLFALPYDRWEGYAAERAKVVDALRRLVNVVVLTTDMHANVVGDVRRVTFAPSGPVASGITEVITGPVATNTFAQEIDNVLGRAGVGSLIAAVFFKPPIPTGLGLPCVALDTYGYAQVTVTPARLTVALKDLNGKPVRDVLGAPCARVALAAK